MLVYTRDVKGGGPVNGIRRIRGETGNQEKGAEEPRLLSVEILSVGPMFRELDMRRLHYYVERPAFFRHVPV
jgi:hypothetical protein